MRSFPSVDQDFDVDIAVIGGGIAGVGAAYWASRMGLGSVTLFESRAIASAASGRNAGFVMAVAPENFPTTDDPTSLEEARRIWAFTATNQQLIETAIDEHDIDCEYRKLGSLGLAADEAEWVWTKAAAAQATSSGLEVSLLESEELPGEWLRSHYHGGAWFPCNAEMHPARFVQGVAAAACSQGVRIFESASVEKLNPDGDGNELRVGQFRIHTGRVLVATNAYTSMLMPDLVEAIRPIRGQVLATSPLDRQVAGCPVYANRGFQYWRQTPSGRLVLGGWRDIDMATEIGTSENLNPRVQAELDRAVLGLIGGPVSIDFRWSGIMGFTPDRRPLVGPVLEYENVMLAAGYSGHGLAMAFHASREAVNLLAGRGSEYRDLFDPARFSQPSSGESEPRAAAG